MVKKGWWKEREATVHITSIMRKQKEKYATDQLTSSFLLSVIPWPIEWQ